MRIVTKEDLKKLQRQAPPILEREAEKIADLIQEACENAASMGQNTWYEDSAPGLKSRISKGAGLRQMVLDALPSRLFGCTFDNIGAQDCIVVMW